MKKPTCNDARIDASVAVIELRSLLVVDAPISRQRAARLVEKASSLAKTAPQCAHVVQTLKHQVEKRFARNQDTFEPSSATLAAPPLLDALQNRTA